MLVDFDVIFSLNVTVMSLVLDCLSYSTLHCIIRDILYVAVSGIVIAASTNVLVDMTTVPSHS